MGGMLRRFFVTKPYRRFGGSGRLQLIFEPQKQSQQVNRPVRITSVVIVAVASTLLPVASSGARGPEVVNVAKGQQDVFFAFDDVSIEATRGLKLEMVVAEKHPNNPVIPRGKAGDPDSSRASMPAVLYENGRWRMWYPAQPIGSSWYHSRVGYAESEDGITWRKPELGLHEYRGSLRNNLVKSTRGISTVSVIVDNDAPPDRRYVLAGEDMSWWRTWSLTAPCTTRVDTSPDGLHWKPLRDKPGLLSQMNETYVIYKFQGQYHIGGHQVSPLVRLPLQTYPNGKVHMLGPRTAVVWRSPRLDRWPLENTKAFFKPMRSSSPFRKGWNGEQVHMGVAAINAYRNVCLGVYGQWHHPPIEDEDGWQDKYDGAAVSCDLGLVISNDGLHFREPAPGYTLVARDQELRWDRDHRDNKKTNIMLMQGSMVNAGTRTHLFYAASTPGGNVAAVHANIGLATWPRDRLGYLSLIDERTTGQFVSRTVESKSGMKLFVNADIPDGSSLQVYLLDEHGLDVLQHYDATDGGKVKNSGLDVAVAWKDQQTLPKGRFKIRCELTGKAKVFALYLRETSPSTSRGPAAAGR